MRFVAGSSALAVAVLSGCSSMPGSAPPAADAHAAHQSAGTAPAPAGYDQQMKMMHEMHRKMAAAKTPEERSALMQDHMKTMHDGMGMMGRMRGGPGATPMDHESMKRRMDMMEMMMQMMMDREGMKPPAAK